jgi:hypothetical protein
VPQKELSSVDLVNAAPGRLDETYATECLRQAWIAGLWFVDQQIA